MKKKKISEKKFEYINITILYIYIYFKSLFDIFLINTISYIFFLMNTTKQLLNYEKCYVYNTFTANSKS